MVEAELGKADSQIGRDAYLLGWATVTQVMREMWPDKDASYAVHYLQTKRWGHTVACLVLQRAARRLSELSHRTEGAGVHGGTNDRDNATANS